MEQAHYDIADEPIELQVPQGAHTPEQKEKKSTSTLVSGGSSSQSSLPPKEVAAPPKPPGEEGWGSVYKQMVGLDEYSAAHNPYRTPPKITGPMWWNRLRYHFFTTYRRLFGIVFVANMIGLGIVARTHHSRTPGAIANGVAVNLSAAGLIRLPHIINLFYLMCNAPKSFPLFIRVALADVSHFGGVHSGCGFSALCWFILLCGVLTRDYVTKNPPTLHDAGVITLSFIILPVIMGIVISAYPKIRFKKHDVFEFVHRFSGWVLTALFWAFVMVFANRARIGEGKSMGSVLVQLPSFWFAIVLTFAFGIPWITLRKVPVVAEHLSNHAVRLHFSHVQTKFAQGIAVSHHPLKDWHNFAGIPNIDGTKGFSCIVSRVGDFTGGMIENKPTMLWKRGIPGSGFGHAIILFKRVLLVTTGSGMGPCLSLIVSDRMPKTRIFWQTRNPRKTYGDKILDLVNHVDPNAIICDTDIHGRQDIFAAAWDMAMDFEAEAVFVVSRPPIVERVRFEFQARGIPAFGPAFDQ